MSSTDQLQRPDERPRRRLRAPARTRPRGVAARAGRILDEVAEGRLAGLPVSLSFWDGSVLRAADPGAPTVIIRERSALAHLLRAPGQVGLGRAWVSGAIDVDGDLEAVLVARAHFAGVELSRRDRAQIALEALRTAGPRVLIPPPVPAVEARTPGRLHSLGRDRTAIRHHYDVSNRFYELVLGPSMVYSCAYFEDPSDTLEVAQERKLELICRKLRLAPGDRLLDIGCGWGSLLLHAAEHHGVRGVGVTLSGAQAELARRRIRDAGLSDRLEVRSATIASSTPGRSTRSPASACTSTSGAASSTTTRSASTRCSVPAGSSSTTGSRGCTRRRRTATRSSRATCSRTASCIRSPTWSARWRRTGWRSATSSRCASTTRSRSAPGARTSTATAPRRSARRGASASACGGSTCSAPRSPSRRARSPSTRCSAPAPARRTGPLGPGGALTAA